MTPPVSGGLPEPLNDQADQLLADVKEAGHLGADFHRRAWAILEALAALKYSELTALGGLPEQGLREALYDHVLVRAEVDAPNTSWYGRDACGWSIYGQASPDAVYQAWADHATEKLRAALERPRPALPHLEELRRFDRHLRGTHAALQDKECLKKIVAVMCERGLALDVLVSEIQDFLTMAGYDVPLRSYADAGATLPAEHAPPDPTDFGLLSRAIELLMANEREYAPNNAASDWYLRDQRVLALVREVTTRGSRPALAGSPDELAELAQDFFVSWQNPLPNSVHAVTEFIDYVRGRVSGTPEETTKP